MNAIILAAGMGTRLRPLTNEIPKCLVRVNGIPMVERQIQYLHEVGITDITLVSGYKAEKLEYLKDKYKVGIIYNDKYDIYNNIYSLFLAREKMENTFVIEGDVYMDSNCFTRNIHNSTYFSKKIIDFKNEWELITDTENRLVNIEANKNGSGYIMSGISYWTLEDSINIVKHLLFIIEKNNYANLFWDNIILDIYKNLTIKICKFNDIYEIDTVEDLRSVESLLKEK